MPQGDTSYEVHGIWHGALAHNGGTGTVTMDVIF
jgi:hypothetical protein